MVLVLIIGRIQRIISIKIRIILFRFVVNFRYASSGRFRRELCLKLESLLRYFHLRFLFQFEIFLFQAVVLILDRITFFDEVINPLKCVFCLRHILLVPYNTPQILTKNHKFLVYFHQVVVSEADVAVLGFHDVAVELLLEIIDMTLN